MAPTLLISSTKLSKFQDPPQLPPSRRSTGHRSHVTAPNAAAPHVTHPLILPRKSITTFQFKSAAARSQLLAPRLLACMSLIITRHHGRRSRALASSAAPRAALPTPSPSMLLRCAGGRSCALHGFLSAVSGCSPCSVERWHPCIFRGHCDDPSAQQFKALSQMVLDSVAFQSSEGSRENGCRKGYPRFRSEE